MDQLWHLVRYVPWKVKIPVPHLPHDCQFCPEITRHIFQRRHPFDYIIATRQSRGQPCRHDTTEESDSSESDSDDSDSSTDDDSSNNRTSTHNESLPPPPEPPPSQNHAPTTRRNIPSLPRNHHFIRDNGDDWDEFCVNPTHATRKPTTPTSPLNPPSKQRATKTKGLLAPEPLL